MAELIPTVLDDKTPPGEKEVFNFLYRGYENWVALHSLDLAPWNKNLRTEIDFVVIVPEKGILCIEVKSNKNITYDGNWYPKEIKRSPFKQALDARFSFYRNLSARAPEYSRIPVVHCCIFTSSRFQITSNLSVEPWILIDSAKFRRYRKGTDLCKDLESIIDLSIKADSKLKNLSHEISKSDIKKIIELCLPIQKTNFNKREEIERREEDALKILIKHQRPLVNIAKSNKRVIVSGGAGTGKTLIGKKIALLKAFEGKRVAFLCYNRLIGEWISEEIKNEKVPPNLIAGSAIKILMEMAGIKKSEINSTRTYWESELPEQIEEKLTDPEFKTLSQFDYLILDEAQDILARPQWWNLICEFLKGGLEDGEYILFGDFENQVLSGRQKMENEKKEILKKSNPTEYQLDENCRNYSIVGKAAVQLSGINNSVYDSFLREGGSSKNYDIFFYKNDNEQLEKLNLWIKSFRKEGYKNSEITILSFRRSNSNDSMKFYEKGNLKLKPAWNNSGEFISYSTIRAFKGMENKVIIITDVIVEENCDTHRNLFYTGLTRATESVFLLCEESSTKIINSWQIPKG